jgi:formate-dependent nitrite reductase membrane component NrfD
MAAVSALLVDRQGATRRVGDVCGIGAGALGIPLAGYTGVLLSTTAVPVWYKARHSLPALFIASSIATCASFFETTTLSPREERIVQRFGLAGKSAELACMIGVEAQSGIGGRLWQAAKVLTLASLVVTLMPGQSKGKRVAGLLGTLGGLALRFAVYQAGFKSSRGTAPG